MISGREMIAVIGVMGSEALGVFPQRCVLVRHRNADCLRCAAVCTTGAISKTDDGICVDPERCIGCGTCATACPSGCLEARNPADEDLAAQLAARVKQTGGQARIACGNARPEDGDVGVTCLGRVDESILLEAVARGARLVELASGDCASCAHASGSRLCDDVLRAAHALLDAAASPARLERVADPAPDGAPAPAPEAPRPPSPAAGTAPQGALTYAHVQRDGTLPHFTPPRRLRLFNSLKHLAPDPDRPLATRLWGSVEIDVDLCRSCRMCTVFCPTGALSRFDTGDAPFGVEHRPALCVQCRLCETLCPEGAITVSDTVRAGDLLRGAKRRFAMKPLGWSPDSPNSIATRVSRFVNADLLQDPEGTITRSEFLEGRAYARERQRQRDDIRSGR